MGGAHFRPRGVTQLYTGDPVTLTGHQEQRCLENGWEPVGARRGTRGRPDWRVLGRCLSCGTTRDFYVSHVNNHRHPPKCRECANGVWLERLRKRAERMGLELLSREYAGMNNKRYSLRCSLCSHEWTCEGKKIGESGCPSCPSGKYERQFRHIMEDLFGCPFPSARNLEWLRNPLTGYYLELDLFNEEMSLAFEFDGDHHRGQGPYAHNYEAIAQRDKIKDDLCRSNGVCLVRVPSTVFRKGLDAVRELVGERLIASGRVLPSGFWTKSLGLQDMRIDVFSAWVGDAIKSEREWHGYSQRELAEMVGCCYHTTIGCIEREWRSGYRTSAETLRGICELFEWDWDSLIEGHEECPEELLRAA